MKRKQSGRPSIGASRIAANLIGPKTLKTKKVGRPGRRVSVRGKQRGVWEARVLQVALPSDNYQLILPHHLVF